MTPTARTGRSTAKVWAILRYRPAAMISSRRISSASRRTSRRSSRDLADAPHGQAGAGERVPPDDVVGQAQEFAELADLVLEQVAQRLDQLEAQFRRQAADVVVQLDVGRRAAAWRMAGFDHVGIERALGQELRVSESICASRLKTSMNVWPMILRFSCGSVTPAQAGQGTASAASDHAQVDLEMVAEGRLDRLPLVLPQQAVVDEDARQPVADGLVQQGAPRRTNPRRRRGRRSPVIRADLLADGLAPPPR